MPTKLIFGCGFLGHPVALRWLKEGHAVYALTRSPERAESLASEGISPVLGDITRPESLGNFPAADSILFAVGYDRSAGYEIDKVYVTGLANVLDQLDTLPRRFIYISSTGVYGQTDGRWLDEDSPCQPRRAGGRACLAAEKLLSEHEIAPRTVSLRCAGLYGPGRIPRLESVRAQRAISARGDTYLNLIHVEDAVEAVLAVDRASHPSSVYVVSDGHPVVRRDFYDELARLLGVAPPQLTLSGDDENDRRRGSENKRMRNDRIIHELGIVPKNPNYREGLASILGSADGS